MAAKENKMSFITELKELMKKHNVASISFEYEDNDGGVYDEHVLITEEGTDKEIFSVEGFAIHPEDLKDDYVPFVRRYVVKGE